jgi:penicillin-binding protein 1A
MLRAFYRILIGIAFCLGLVASVMSVLFYYCGHDLPNHAFLQNYKPPEGTRIYSRDNKFYREFVSEYRIFVPIHEIPPLLIKAFLAAEDKNFYYHPGIDLISLIRASVYNSLRSNWHQNPLGASTITQQVAKNFLVGNDRSFIRKVREAIMSMRIENELSKDRILELYFNQIYLGMRSYGVAAAAYTYFQKSLHELTLGECAFLASLPKAPSNYHPVKESKKALSRRNWILRRLVEDGVVTDQAAKQAQEKPLKVSLIDRTNQISYVGEDIKRELAQRFKDVDVYQEGFSIFTTLDTDIQKLCEHSLRNGLEAYDKRHGYRGVIAHLSDAEMKIWQKSLMTKIQSLRSFPGDRKTDIAVVLAVLTNSIEIGFVNGHKGIIDNADFEHSGFNDLKKNGSKKINIQSSTFKIGDVILTSARAKVSSAPHYQLDQIPDVTGAMVIIDADTGEIISMTGGYSIDISQFNCATQAFRQPGSSFKPFVYLAALELGYTKDTIIDDSPIEIDLGGGLGVYNPKNDSRKSLGPTPLYLGIENSVNQMTVRLAHQIGMERIQNITKRLGVMDNMPPQLAMSLGAGETTLVKISAAYASIVNGGKRVHPHLIKRIHDRNGRVILQTPPAFNDHLTDSSPIYPNQLKDDRIQAIDSRYTDQMQEMLRGVVTRGNAKKLNYLKERYHIDIGGKTGTTNDYKDAWFVGFVRFPSQKTWIVGTFVGFASPKSLGKNEGGRSVAVPIFETFILSLSNL